MSKIYAAYLGINYEPGDMQLYTTMEKAKEGANKALASDFYDYVDVYEYTLINDEYVESKEPVYEVKR